MTKTTPDCLEFRRRSTLGHTPHHGDCMRIRKKPNPEAGGST